MKRIISVILCLAMLGSVVICVTPAFASQNGIDIPLIYVEGQGHALYKNIGTPEKEKIYPIEIPEEYINEKLDTFLPVFAEAFFTQEWDEFCDELYNIIVPVMEEVRLDNNGEASNGTGIDWTWSESSLQDKKVNGKYQIQDYIFEYDWRLDPWVLADELHAYIEGVKKVTGAEEVALLGRCLGASIVAAYMTKYDGEHVRDCIFYASASHGAAMASKAFCGELFLEGDGIERYFYDIQLFEDETLENLIDSLITLMNKTYGIDIISAAVDNVYEDIYLNIIPPILSETFATFPGYWSMVTEGDFEKAVDTVFYGSEPGEYAGLIEKIENYHQNVRLVMDDKYLELNKNGVEFSNVSKYGLQIIPVSKENNVVSDGTCEISQSSMGATAAGIESTFDADYIDNAIVNGTAKYISPDKIIDASTCLFSDSTWFVKDLVHDYFPEDIENIFIDIINNENHTVFDNPRYPQYLVYEADTELVVPMTADNLDTKPEWRVTFIDALITFTKSLFEIIKEYIASQNQ